jgi:hypothetical protein
MENVSFKKIKYFFYGSHDFFFTFLPEQLSLKVIGLGSVTWVCLGRAPSQHRTNEDAKLGKEGFEVEGCSAEAQAEAGGVHTGVQWCITTAYHIQWHKEGILGP